MYPPFEKSTTRIALNGIYHKQGVPRAANKMSRFDHKNCNNFFSPKIILCAILFLHLVLSDLIHKSVRMCSKNVKLYYEKKTKHVWTVVCKNNHPLTFYTHPQAKANLFQVSTFFMNRFPSLTSYWVTRRIKIIGKYLLESQFFG